MKTKCITRPFEIGALSKIPLKVWALGILLAEVAACRSPTASQIDSAENQSPARQVGSSSGNWLDPSARKSCLVFAQLLEEGVDGNADHPSVSISPEDPQSQNDFLQYAMLRDPGANESSQLFVTIDPNFAVESYKKIESGEIKGKWDLPPTKRGIGIALESGTPSQEVTQLRNRVFKAEQVKDVPTHSPYITKAQTFFGSYTAAVAKAPGPKGIQEYFRYSNGNSPFPDYFESKKNLEVLVDGSSKKQSLTALEFLSSINAEKQNRGISQKGNSPAPFAFFFESNDIPEKDQKMEFTLVPASENRARLFITRFANTGTRVRGFELVCQPETTSAKR